MLIWQAPAFARQWERDLVPPGNCIQANNFWDIGLTVMSVGGLSCQPWQGCHGRIRNIRVGSGLPSLPVGILIQLWWDLSYIVLPRKLSPVYAIVNSVYFFKVLFWLFYHRREMASFPLHRWEQGSMETLRFWGHGDDKWGVMVCIEVDWLPGTDLHYPAARNRSIETPL